MKKHKICLSVDKSDSAFESMRDRLAELADVTVTGLIGYDLRGVDIFIGKQLDEKALQGADKLKAVFAYKTGVDGFPLDALNKKGVALYNSHVNSRYIAEYAFALASTLVFRTAEYDRAMRGGDWLLGDPYWQSIFGITVGLVGYGGIGRALHEILVANGIAACTLDRGKHYENIRTVKTLDELCAACDLLVLSLPQTPQTDKIIDARVLKLLSGKYIVNVGRCNCIDEKALYASLAFGELKGAAIDTWREKQRDPQKPLKPFDMPFDKLNNVLLSSHKAMQAADGHDRYVVDTTDNVIAYISDETPKNRVDLTQGY